MALHIPIVAADVSPLMIPAGMGMFEPAHAGCYRIPTVGDDVRSLRLKRNRQSKIEVAAHFKWGVLSADFADAADEEKEICAISVICGFPIPHSLPRRSHSPRRNAVKTGAKTGAFRTGTLFSGIHFPDSCQRHYALQKPNQERGRRRWILVQNQCNKCPMIFFLNQP